MFNKWIILWVIVAMLAASLALHATSYWGTFGLQTTGSSKYEMRACRGYLYLNNIGTDSSDMFSCTSFDDRLPWWLYPYFLDHDWLVLRVGGNSGPAWFVGMPLWHMHIVLSLLGGLAWWRASRVKFKRGFPVTSIASPLNPAPCKPEPRPR